MIALSGSLAKPCEVFACISMHAGGDEPTHRKLRDVCQPAITISNVRQVPPLAGI